MMNYIVCLECNDLFKGKTANHRFCSTGCRTAFYSHGKMYIRGYGKIRCRGCNHLFSKNAVNQIYCSSKCRVDSCGYVKAEPVRGNCLWCDGEFVKTQSNKRYCSSDCGILYRKANTSEVPEVLLCLVCERKFEPRFPHQIYCAENCKKEVHKTISYFAIFARDSFTCVYCGGSPMRDASVELVTSFVKPWKSSLDNNASNVVTSCTSCKQASSKVKVKKGEDLITTIARRNGESKISPMAPVSIPPHRR